MRNRITQSLFIMLVVLTTSAASARTVTILPFSGDSVHAQIRSAARDALSIFLMDQKEDVRGNTLTEATIDRSKADETAKAVGATHYIEGRVTRLGRRAIVQVSRFEIGQKTPEYTDRMTAGSPTDLETIMQRLALSLATGEKAMINDDIRTVTLREQSPLRRRVANHYFGVSLGGSVLALDKTEFLPGLGFNWLFDNREVLFGADFRSFGLGNTNQGYFELAIGGYYPLSQKSTTAYVGGGLALSGASLEQGYNESTSGYYDEYDREDDVGLSIFAATGLLIGRTSTVSLRPEFGYSLGTYHVAGHLVHGPRFSITLGF